MTNKEKRKWEKRWDKATNEQKIEMLEENNKELKEKNLWLKKKIECNNIWIEVNKEFIKRRKGEPSDVIGVILEQEKKQYEEAKKKLNEEKKDRCVIQDIMDGQSIKFGKPMSFRKHHAEPITTAFLDGIFDRIGKIEKEIRKFVNLEEEIRKIKGDQK